jgi:flagellar basal body P-ring formation protein FlgA
MIVPRTLAPKLLLALALAGVAPAFAQETAVVATRTIYPGETIGAEALDEVPLKRGNRDLSAMAMLPGEVAGKVASRTLLPGRLIPLNSVREPYLVEAGAPVQVLLIQGALTISLSGVPLEPGAAGDLIKIRNLDSGAVFSGIVMADGTVRVGAT